MAIQAKLQPMLRICEQKFHHWLSPRTLTRKTDTEGGMGGGLVESGRRANWGRERQGRWACGWTGPGRDGTGLSRSTASRGNNVLHSSLGLGTGSPIHRPVTTWLRSWISRLGAATPHRGREEEKLSRKQKLSSLRYSTISGSG